MVSGMTNSPRLDEQLTADTQRFEVRKSMLLFKKLHYRASGEKVVEGFRYFSCGIGALVSAFEAQDFAAIAKLPFALDDEGDPDTSAVMLDLAYTESGAFIAAQPVEYRDYNPTPVAPMLLFEGAQANACFAIIKQLDQSA